MLQKIIHKIGSRRVVYRSDYKHSFDLPSDDRARVHFVDGQLADPEQSFEHLKLMQSLRDADRLNLRRLFHNLAPPPMESLAGEYDSELLDQGSPSKKVLTGRVFGIHGAWLGKAFHPVSENAGVGYNFFQSDGEVERKLAMDTTIGPSILDDGPSLMIRYHAKNRGLIRWLCGEIRQVTPNIMLGIGIFGPDLGQRDIYRRKIPFVLVGPCRPYQHESGSAPDRSVSGLAPRFDRRAEQGVGIRSSQMPR